MTAPAPLAFRALEAGGRREWLTGRPREGAPALLILPPLFAEMNRTRALIADLMAALSTRGFAPWSVDLPGTGESETALETVSWADWREAAAAAAAAIGAAGTIALRGGALLEPDHPLPLTEGRAGRHSRWEDEALPSWRFAPVAGAAVLRGLIRARLASEAEPRTDAAALDAALAAGPVTLAGYRLAPALSQPLREAVPGEASAARTVALAGATADREVDGPALWRRAEPGRAPELAETLAGDIAAWRASC